MEQFYLLRSGRMKIISKLKNKASAYSIRSKRYIEILAEEKKFKRLSKKGSYPIVKEKLMLEDKYSDHPIDAHYIYHPVWAAQIIKKINPKKHVDISSLMSFSTIISAFVPTEYYDFRSPHIDLNNYKTGVADLRSLPFKDESIKCLSCMHTVEHIGLGRYGDEIDPFGDRKAISELQRVAKKGGDILFAVPVGKPGVVFNAHRVYKYSDIIKWFDKCKLQSFSAVLDNSEKGLVKNVPEKVLNAQSYACGCFWFKKK